MWDITAAVARSRGGDAASAAQRRGGSRSARSARSRRRSGQPAARSAAAEFRSPDAAVRCAAPPRTGADRHLHAGDGLAYVISVLEQAAARAVPTPAQPAMTPEQQMAALQMSTALQPAARRRQHAADVQRRARRQAAGRRRPGRAAPPPWRRSASRRRQPARAAGCAVLAAPAPVVPAAAERPLVSAAILVPHDLHACRRRRSMCTVRTVTLGGSGTRTSAVTIGGAAALPFRHFEGDPGRPPVVAMEVFDQPPKRLPGQPARGLRRAARGPRGDGALLRRASWAPS